MPLKVIVPETIIVMDVFIGFYGFKSLEINALLKSNDVEKYDQFQWKLNP